MISSAGPGAAGAPRLPQADSSSRAARTRAISPGVLMPESSWQGPHASAACQRAAWAATLAGAVPP